MATVFEAWLVGDDAEHLAAVGEALLDEVSRVERLLSRHDPAAEVARINREAPNRPVRVDRELFAILEDCARRREQTDGYFDVWTSRGACGAGRKGGPPTPPEAAEAVRLDPEARTVRFLAPDVSLDLGGYGKGYALDASARILDEFGVGAALLHGGTSSVLARGRPEDDTAWRVGLRDPFGAATEAEVARLELVDVGLSSSAVHGPGSLNSDLIDPVARRPLRRQAACSVIAPTATDAEVLSTALLAMGRRRAARHLKRGGERLPLRSRVAWIARRHGQSVVEWLGRKRL